MEEGYYEKQRENDILKALEFHGEESIDPAEGAAIAREAYENLFSEPMGDYLTNLVSSFNVAQMDV